MELAFQAYFTRIDQVGNDIRAELVIMRQLIDRGDQFRQGWSAFTVGFRGFAFHGRRIKQPTCHLHRSLLLECADLSAL